MYRAPRVTRMGTFVELTQCGADPPGDGGPGQGNGSTTTACNPGGGGTGS